jgi:hypothetical protein
LALSAYIGAWDEQGVVIGSEESDKYIGLALVHSYGILADLLSIFCKFFEVDRPDLFAKIESTWNELVKEQPPDQSRESKRDHTR